MSRWYVGIALSFLWVSVLAQTPPFVPESGTAKEILSVIASPSLAPVQTDPLTVGLEVLIAVNPDLNPNSVSVVDVTTGQSVLLGSLAPAAVTIDGQVYSGDILIDASSLGTFVLQVSAAYAGDPRRARSSTSVEITLAPEPPVVVCADPDNPDCPPIIVVPPVGSIAQILVDYFDDVTPAEADELRASISTVIGVSITGTGVVPITNAYTYDINIDDATADPVAADALVQDVIDQFLASEGRVQNAFRNYVIVTE